jgi:C-terminal processing protease CtpA/Prc
MTLTLEDTHGARRTVTVPPLPVTDYVEVVQPLVSDRPSGPLADLGAPALFYLNVNSLTSSGEARALLAQAAGSSGMVLDMRGYPSVDHYELAARLVRELFLSPIFDVTDYTRPGAPSLNHSQYLIQPLDPPTFDGPIVLLTGPHAVSAAENFMQMLRGAGRLVSIVGERSAGTNGNLTYLSLPCGFYFSYTGMEVLNPDGSTFHGVGIAPDITVPLTRTDLRDGIDRDLLTAIGVLQ